MPLLELTEEALAKVELRMATAGKKEVVAERKRKVKQLKEISSVARAFFCVTGPSEPGRKVLHLSQIGQRARRDGTSIKEGVQAAPYSGLQAADFSSCDRLEDRSRKRN